MEKGRALRRMEQRLRTLLNRNVREELNLLLTEPPQAAQSGFDFGLFCREHAYLTYLLAWANGVPLELSVGHYFVRAPGGDANNTLDSGGNHAWCTMGSMAPIDLSMTFRYAGALGFEEIDRPILGEGLYEPYTVMNLGEEEFRRHLAEQMAGERSDAVINYWRVERVIKPLVELLDRPYDFLISPAQRGVPSLTDLGGKDFFAKVVMHLDEVAQGRSAHILRPPVGPKEQDRAMNRIAAGYPDAMRDLKAAAASLGPEPSWLS